MEAELLAMEFSCCGDPDLYWNAGFRSSSSSPPNFIATQVLNKTSGPLCVTYYTTVVMSMLLWPIVCIAVWSAEQFRLQCTLECPQRRQRIPNLCRGDGEGAIADGPVQDNRKAVRERMSVLFTNRNSHTGFRLVLTSLTLHDLDRRNDRRRALSLR